MREKGVKMWLVDGGTGECKLREFEQAPSSRKNTHDLSRREMVAPAMTISGILTSSSSTIAATTTIGLPLVVAHERVMSRKLTRNQVYAALVDKHQSSRGLITGRAKFHERSRRFTSFTLSIAERALSFKLVHWLLGG